RQRLNRLAAGLFTGLPFAFALTAVAWRLFWGYGASWLDLSLLAGFYLLSIVGVSDGFHRLFTHETYQAKPWVEVGLAVAGSMAIEGSLFAWVADHRRHHQYADKIGDPHSPHLAQGALAGLWHAHTGWLFAPERTDIEHYARHLTGRRSLRIVSDLFPLWVVLSLALPGLIGLAVTRSWLGGMQALLWGGLARTALVHQSTWSINSICHFFGRRPFRTADRSTNHWFMGIIGGGEGWHNNHHAFQTSARLGLCWWQVDIGWYFIKLMSWLHQVRQINVPSAQALRKRLTSANAPVEV
ncbi:MAG TPA: acyl-CoA desaturase, partial [Candidatus Saccharimonadia bacterium]|nr:acyl-CoA desaturase [Candidatus Saccharimonadia bacterium]